MTAMASMNFAPMLAVLFIGARMRALNMDQGLERLGFQKLGFQKNSSMRFNAIR